MSDHRTRPWKKHRVVVEVTVPPTSRVREKDLIYAVETALGHTVDLPRPGRPDTVSPAVRVKSFIKFLPAYLLMEKRKKRK